MLLVTSLSFGCALTLLCCLTAEQRFGVLILQMFLNLLLGAVHLTQGVWFEWITAIGIVGAITVVTHQRSGCCNLSILMQVVKENVVNWIYICCNLKNKLF